MAQLVKNPPAMRETWVRSLGWEDPLEKGKATPSSILAWGIPWTTVVLGRKVITNLDSILKSRHHFANKGLSSQGYDFSSSHVWM